MQDALVLLRGKSRQTRSLILAVVAELDDGQLTYRPAPHAHSIAFTLWHIARSDDNVQSDLTGDALLWTRGSYAARWGYPADSTATGWDDERAAALALPPKAELLSYVREVFAAVDAAVEGIDPLTAQGSVDSRFTGERSTRVEVLAGFLTHENRHLGEIEYLKGLQGLRGTATV